MERQGTAPDFVWKEGRQVFADATFTSFSADINRFSIPNAIEHDASLATTERDLSQVIAEYFPDMFPDWSPPDFAINPMVSTTLGSMRMKHFGFRYEPKTIDPDGFGRLSALQRGVQKAVKAQPELQRLPLFKSTLGDTKPKAKAKPEVDPLPEKKTREKEKTALETAPSGDPEKPGKPLMWRTPVNYEETTSTGGLAGGLDFRFPKEKTFSVSIKVPDVNTYTLSVDKSKSMPWHAHHTWPKFVGGAPKQPLMSVRDMVHISVIHPALYAYLGFLGHPISNTETANKKFIQKLKDNATFRKDLKRQMTYFYIRVNELTDPKMPSSAYEKGIDYSMDKLATP